MTETSQLLTAYAERGDEAAFRELVARYVDLVFSVARRRVNGDVQLAEDVTQSVFADLARRAREGTWRQPPAHLGGWLHRHTCFVAANLTRAQRRRQQRETQAASMTIVSSSSDATWRDLAPELDEAVNQLAPDDRHAIVLRFYERRDLRSVGAALGISGDAAQKRIQRALDKLRNLLARRGVTLSLAALSGFLTERAVTAAPTSLARQTAQAALAGAAAGGLGGVFSLFRGVLSLKGALLLGTATVGLGVAAWIFLPARTALPAAAETETPLPSVASKSADGPGARSKPEVPLAEAVIPGSTWLADRALQLTVVTADTGEPVPGVKIYRWIRAGSELVEREPIWADRFGRCAIPLPVGLTLLQLTTHSEGFADTQLHWRPDRGETVPKEYTLRLDRAVPIGGSVVDADGQPVEGAEVWFLSLENVSIVGPTECHLVGPEAAITDEDGRWQIDWIAEDLIDHLCGRAHHSQWGSSKEACVNREPQMERLLRAGEFVFHLRMGCTLRGIVVDESNRPIAGATVLVGGVNFSDARIGKTAPDGTFMIAGCNSQPGLVFAEADGYAPTTVATEIGKDMPPIRLVLNPGKTLRLRIVDLQGSPIEGARLRLHTFPFPPGVLYPDSPPPWFGFSANSDSEGRVVWENAPDQELSFDLTASGYLWRYGLKFRPDGQEHEVELAPALLVEGTVRDAQTGELIPQFRMFCGYPEKRFAGNPPALVTRPHWIGGEPFLLDYTGGRFHHLMENPPLAGVPHPSYYFKFEAEGYQSYVSRLIAADEGIVRLDVRLEPATETVVTVRLPNGRPAAHIQVGLAYPGAGLVLEPGGFSPQAGTAGDVLRRTDEAGRFRLPANPALEKVIAACPQGYAESSPEALTTEPVMQLLPWGRISGTFTRRGKSVAGIRLRVALKTIDWDTFSLNINSFQTETDATGQFVFDRVPPGIHRLIRLREARAADGGTATVLFPVRQVEVCAGETTEVQLGKGGYSITVRPGGPKNFSPERGWRIGGIVGSPMPQPPITIRSNPAALAQWFHRPEVRAARAERFSWPLETDDEGVCFAEGLPPGRYVLRLWAANPARKGGRFQAERSLVIPDTPPTGQLDLGEIPLRPVP